MKMTKRILAIVLVLAMTISFAACETSGTNENLTAQITANSTEKEIVKTPTTETVEVEVDKAPAVEQPSETVVEVSKDDETEPVIDLSKEESEETPATGVTTGQATFFAGSETVENIPTVDPLPETTVTPVAPAGEYNEGIVLVKVKESFNEADLGTLEYASAEPLYKGSKWYTITLSDSSKTEEAVGYLTSLGTFENVDYDYIMATTGPKEDAKDNPKYDDQVNLGLSNIPNGWTHNGKAPGGSPDVVVAVIDTGVDYNHLDLRNNIWINTAEIPDNGKDDDGNGYVDDVYGWDCVGNDKDPMDDNGHGTHVAGIIAAENNKEGGIGVAYNCKVMVLKAGNSSGYFNNSDIAEAIQYAYMNGASVINMSFGGSNVSIAVEDALENAYNSCILVAAAGNDSACNNLACPVCLVKKVSYPAALPYVIGVMSVDKDGKHTSIFSNYDHNPYNSIEYEVYAVGEGVGSTWPSNKYACLNGTSMAAPTVSGIAALLRSYYSDREMYSTKFIQSQIINTGTICIDGAHTVADVQEALTKLPKPEVNLYDYYVDDSTAISANNNGNGVVDAGETIHLHFSLHNRGGVATDVNVSIDTYRSTVGDETLTDPYFTLVNTSLTLSDIGTYSVRESGDKYFEIVVDGKCPNDYLADFNIRYTYENGLDADDKAVYEDDGKQKAQFTVSSGYYLPTVIDKDTTFTNSRRYIVSDDVIIPQGVSVTFEEGTELVFLNDSITVYGMLQFEGKIDNNIRIYPSEGRSPSASCEITVKKEGFISLNYVTGTNLIISDENYRVSSKNDCSYISNSYLTCGASIGSIWVANITDSYLDLCRNALYCINLDSNIIYFNTNAASIGCDDDSYIDGAILKNARISNNVIFSKYYGSVSSSNGGQIRLKQCGKVTNNYFYSLGDNSITTVCKFKEFDSQNTVFENNLFDQAHQENANDIISGYFDSTGTPTVDVYGSLANAALLWPHVVNVEMFDGEGNPTNVVGKEEITVRVTFNRDMDVTKDTYLTFGTIEPYADYRIDGEWISSTVWEGKYTLKAQIENGQNFLKVKNACAAEDHAKTVFGEYQLHEFTIDTTAAMAMNLMAFPQYEGIELRFEQDDYDTLLGYNIYRSEDKDGNFVKLNPTILLPDENTFFDDNAEPGKTYWYTYTVVLTDFSESAPAGKVQATALDTMAPSLYHTPVNQGYENNNLVISATATDNVAVEKVTLYYRTVGDEAWKSLTMSKQNDKFSATIFGSDVTLAGIEYYIIATDGLNTVQKGSAEVPYTVLVKSADSLLGKGDVDGNGTVTTKDALMLMQCLNGELLLSDDAFKRADLDASGKLSSAEALRILQYVNGNVTNLDM